MLAFVEWLRSRNDAQVTPRLKARFYGLDLYSLRASMEAVVRYLDRVDPDEAARARARYSCFDHVGGEGQAYGYALAYSGAIPCENEVVMQLIELRRERRDTFGETAGWPTTSSSSPSRTHVWCETPRSTTSRCIGRTCPRGTFGTVPWPQRSIP